MMTWAAAAGQWHFEYYFPKIIDWVLAPLKGQFQISGIVFRNNNLDFFDRGPGTHTNFLFKSYENTIISTIVYVLFIPHLHSVKDLVLLLDGPERI